jgi:hypothetical protein
MDQLRADATERIVPRVHLAKLLASVLEWSRYCGTGKELSETDEIGLEA